MDDAPILERGNTTFDPMSGRLSTPKKSTFVSKGKGKVLAALMERSDTRPLAPYEVLIDRVWDNRPDGPEFCIVRVYIARIRAILAEIGSNLVIQTNYGRGYALVVEDKAGSTGSVNQRLRCR